MTDSQRAIVQSQVDYGYTLFTRGVAKGRNLPLATVRQIAQGRVWSGEAAKKRGLVDRFGGLQAAVDAAAGLAKLKAGSYTVETFSAAPSLSQLIKSHFGIHAGAAAVAQGVPRAWLAPLQRAATTLAHFNDPQGRYAYCFCALAPAPAWR